MIMNIYRNQPKSEISTKRLRNRIEKRIKRNADLNDKTFKSYKEIDVNNLDRYIVFGP